LSLKDSGLLQVIVTSSGTVEMREALDALSAPVERQKLVELTEISFVSPLDHDFLPGAWLSAPILLFFVINIAAILITHKEFVNIVSKRYCLGHEFTTA
jgi:hypothetical protein